MGSNREKSNIGIALLEKFTIWTYPISHYRLNPHNSQRMSGLATFKSMKFDPHTFEFLTINILLYIKSKQKVIRK